jgi:hypothetical protein
MATGLSGDPATCQFSEGAERAIDGGAWPASDATGGTQLAAIRCVFWLDVGAEVASMEELVAQVGALTRVAEELDARLAGAGIGGLEGAVAICQRLRTIFAGVSAADIERMLGGWPRCRPSSKRSRAGSPPSASSRQPSNASPATARRPQRGSVTA